MRPQRLAAAAALVCVAGGVAHAQYDNPYTGNTFNNGGSAMIDTMLLNERNRALLQNNLQSSRALAEAQKQRQDGIRQAGALKIKRGQASTRFAAVPFQLEVWLARWKPKTPSE